MLKLVDHVMTMASCFSFFTETRMHVLPPLDLHSSRIFPKNYFPNCLICHSNVDGLSTFSFMHVRPWKKLTMTCFPRKRLERRLNSDQGSNASNSEFHNSESYPSSFLSSFDQEADVSFNTNPNANISFDEAWDYLKLEVIKTILEERSKKTFHILISAGDVMGDIHASNLVKFIQIKSNQLGIRIQISAIAGKRTQQAGAILIGDNSDLSSIGLFEALPFVKNSLILVAKAKEALHENPPHIAILMDYPGVNISFGKYLKKQYKDCKILYFLPPNEWMISEMRTKSIIQMSDLIISVYKQEYDYYKGVGGKVVLTSHPLLQILNTTPKRDRAREILGVSDDSVVFSIFPGSRSQELRMVWPTIAKALQLIQTSFHSNKLMGDRLVFFISVSNPDFIPLLENHLHKLGVKGNIRIWKESSHILMAGSDLAIAKSGSCTLELALFKIPQVVVYKIGSISGWLAKNVFRFCPAYVSLPNLILEYKAIPEFIQDEAHPDLIAQSAMELMPGQYGNSKSRQKLMASYEQLLECLSGPPAYDFVAYLVLKELLLGKTN